MNDDGTMARLPDLQMFAAEHSLKIGTIADLIEYRSRNESLVESVGCREIADRQGDFTAHAFRDKPSRRRAPGAGARHAGRPTTRARCACTSRCRCSTCSKSTGSHALVEPGASLLAHRDRGQAAWPCCSTAAKTRRRAARAVRRHRASPRKPPSAAAWTCAPTASARRSCANSACSKMNLLGSAAPHAEHGAATTSKSPATVTNQQLNGRMFKAQNKGEPTRRSTATACASASCRRASTPSITDALAAACLAELEALGVAADDIHHVHVPGALEVPVALQALAETRRLRRAGRARLRHPRRDLPLRAGRQRDRAPA